MKLGEATAGNSRTEQDSILLKIGSMSGQPVQCTEQKLERRSLYKTAHRQLTSF